MRSSLALAAALMLVGVPAFAQTQQQDIENAEHACGPPEGWSTRAGYTVCVGTTERQVVWRYKPDVAPLFDAFQADRLQLAQKLDAGQITPAAYVDAERALEQTFLEEAKTIPSSPAPAEPEPAEAPPQPAARSAPDLSWLLPSLACLAASFSRIGSTNAINVCAAAMGN